MFFTLSKILWFFISPFNVALFALTGAMLAVASKRFHLARLLGATSWAVLIVFGVLPTGPLLVHALEGQYTAPSPMPRPVHGIIVLGGALDTDIGLTRGMPQTGTSADRIATMAMLARDYPWAKIIYTSGQGALNQNGVAEASMVRDYLHAAYGLNLGRRLVLEDTSRNTYENATNAKELLNPQANQTWLVVTSAWHMPRAMGVFRSQGWSVLPYPTDYLTAPNTQVNQSFFDKMAMSQLAIKEILGLAAYKLAGHWTGAAIDVPPKTP